MQQTEHQITPSPDMAPDKARQGRRGTQVLIILVVALILAAIAWWGAELFGVAITPPASEQVGNPSTVSPSAAPQSSPAPSN